MKIIVLMENSDGSNGCAFEHGLSVYVETEHHKILADTGASEKTIANADLLGVDLSAVDLVFLSHGHYDHSGGILAFYERNQKAPIYMQESAEEAYYNGERYIGIDPKIRLLPTVRHISGNLVVDHEVEVFAGVTARRNWPSGNLALSKKVDGELVQDLFDHEQSLVIHGDREVLICGCAHCGILNILDRYQALFGRDPDIVIGGFHMMKKTEYTEEEAGLVLDTARELAGKPTVFYTGHCTGNKALNLMQPVMKEKLIPLCSGMVICEA